MTQPPRKTNRKVMVLAVNRITDGGVELNLQDEAGVDPSDRPHSCL